MPASNQQIQLFDFSGDKLEVIPDGDNSNNLWIGFRALCEHIGLSYGAQSQKIKDAHWARVAEIETRDSLGKKQSKTFIDIDTLLMWLSRLNPGKVAPQIQYTVIRYQKECVKALRAHFFPANRVQTSAEQLKVLREKRLAAKTALEEKKLQIKELEKVYAGMKACGIDVGIITRYRAEHLLAGGGPDLTAVLPEIQPVMKNDVAVAQLPADATAEEPLWFLASEIEADFGVPQNQAGRIAGKLGLKRDPGYCRHEIEQIHSRGGNIRLRKKYFYNQFGVELIVAEYERRKKE